MPRGSVEVHGVECLTCGKRFSSSRNAIAHAKATETPKRPHGHYRYKNVKVQRVRVNPQTY